MCPYSDNTIKKDLELQIGTVAAATTITVCSQEICLQLDDYLIVWLYEHLNKTSSIAIADAYRFQTH